MKLKKINIRDPFVLYENEKYYLYGTRANNFGCKTGGLMLTFHSPNKTGKEHPVFKKITDTGNLIEIK